MLHQIDENLYQLQIQLPRNPLKILNSYIMTSDKRNLIVDTGFNQPECLEELQAGLRTLGIDMKRTDILATHCHADHTGLISKIASKQSIVYMGRIDKQMFEKTMTKSAQFWAEAEEVFRREGYPEQELQATRISNPARAFTSSGLFPITPLDEGNVIGAGGRNWSVVFTPGHTPGHICLYDKSNKTLITGDHLLFDITPNITWWNELPDALGSYLESLHKLCHYDVDQVLTGHRGIEGSLQKRINELLIHHEDRLNDLLHIVQTRPHSSGYDISSRMKWSIRARSWAEFPLAQKWFAVGEAIAHINHLVLKGTLHRESVNGVSTYECL